MFANAAAWGLAAAIALGAGLAIGWGGHTYVEENLPNWAGRASSASPAPQGSPRADGGEQHTTEDDVDD